MKKTIFIAVLGMAAVAATSSYGQGIVAFSSYLANAGAGALTTFGGTPVGVGYTADLYYFIGTVSDPVNGNVTSAPTGLTSLGSFTAYDNSGGATGSQGLGYFDGATLQIPGYTSGPITFEIVAFNGSSYANSTIRGRSGSFTETSIQTLGNPTTILGDNAPGGQPSFIVAAVAPVPEPTTLALAGLGGLASLVAFRRKQA